jgi:paraquat-inducible protein A
MQEVPLCSDSENFVSCQICRASIRNQELAADEELHCDRCSHVVKRGYRATSLQPAMALAITGFFLVILANTNPIMIFEVAESTQKNLIITGVIQLWDQGYWPIALLVFFSAIAAPFLYFSSILYVSISCCMRKKLPHVRQIMNFVEQINAWNLVPVFAIACLAAVVKLKLLGNVHWRSGMLWVVLLSICSVVLAHAFDKELVEERLHLSSDHADE